jgi:hypothetical protein
VAFGAWLALVGTGFLLLAHYSNQPGPRITAPPEQSSLSSEANSKFRLLMFAHPHCPCTRASVSELARLMSRETSRIDATVYLYRPDGKPDDWALGSLWNSAAAIPGVHVQVDPNGTVAAQFGSATSGDVLLYDASGSLRFHGGITAARGHEGDNLGKSTVMAVIAGDRANVDQTPVFGCAIHPAAQCRRE